MKVFHHLKTKGLFYEIPVDPPEFFVIKEKNPGESVTDRGWMFEMPVSVEHDGKYESHKFAVLIEPDEIERMHEALVKMQQYMESNPIDSNEDEPEENSDSKDEA